LLISATSVMAYPVSAQEAPEPVPLPPLNVETTAKKKAPAKKGAAKKAAPVQQTSPAPQPPPTQPVAQQTDPLPGQAAPVAAGQYNATYATSPKMTGPLLNTPQTVTVVPEAIIQERKSTNLIETLKNTPGITIDAGENGFSSGGLQFSIRGFNAIGNVFVDGTRDNGAFQRDTFNVEQVEIIKGPAADNGRGSAGGYVNIVTKTPTLTDFVEAQVGIGFDEYDSEARRRAAFDVNQASGTVAARLNMFVQDGGVAGRDVAEANAWGAAPSLAFGLNTDTRAIFSYEHVERRDLPDAGVAFNRGGASIWVPGAGPNTVASSGPRDRFFGAPTDFDDVNADSFIARFEHDLSDSVTITNQTRWAEVDRNAQYRIPAITVPGALNFYDRTNDTLSNQTNLAARFYTGQFRHTLSTGVEISREESNSFRFNAATPANSQTAVVNVDTLAGYLYDTVELDRQWQIVGGIRVENYDVEINGAGIPGVASGTFSQTETTVGGKVGIVYKPVREGSLYASYGVSHLPPGSYLSNPDISRTGDGAFPGFVGGADPVELHNYEVGAKWDFFNGKLSTTAAAFHTVKKNVAYGGLHTAAVPAVGWPGRTIAYGEQVVDGIELGIAGNLTEHWKVFGGATWLQSERRHGALVDSWGRVQGNGSDYTSATPPTATANTISTDGDELALTPNFFANLWTTYDVTKYFTVGGGIQYVGESWIGRTDDALRIIKNGRYGKVPDYFLVNLYASYDLTDNVELSLNVDNVFDELYLTTANWNGAWGYLGPPRTYWLATSIKY
jgi:catecholate siderophore receptor